jgi:hypothetical protein
MEGRRWQTGRGTLGSAFVVTGVGLLASACADAGSDASSPPLAAISASATPHSASSTPLSSPSGSGATAATWTGPVRETSNATDQDGEVGSRHEPGDAALDYVDIERVSVDNGGQPHWRLRLADAPPAAATLDSKRTVISYGLAFETTGDEAPDYVVGISNESSSPGGFRVWVTELATGETDEQDGPPYGFPVEFAHPDEVALQGGPGTPGMLFTFLPGTEPPGVTLSTRFYAWASVEEDGAVVAWDYAPDAGWVGAPPEAAATADVDPAPVAVVNPAAPAGFPECQAAEFDFVGEGTLRGLGLDTVTPVPPPDINRVGMIWVTRDLMPYDPGPAGGRVEMTRMLCFEFDDGSGGSGWPVDPTWRPPHDRAPASDDASAGTPSPALPLVAVALVAVAGSVVAFRRRR